MILTATINEVKRRILFDNPQAVVAVKGDYEVNGIAFAFPAIYEDDFDLSTAVKTVYYKATDGIIYNHVVTATDTDTGYPLWVFKDEINKGAFGDVEFALVCDKVEGGNIVKRWVSMITAFKVQRSIEIDEATQEDNEQTYSERLAYLMTQMANMQATVNGLASGAPTPESLVANMQEGHIYVYTGTETGYTAGHLYYYVNGALTDGGQYGGTTVDTTLTVSGAAADAKVVGDEIAEIKEDLSAVSEKSMLAETLQSELFELGMINESGQSTNNQKRIRTKNYIDVSSGKYNAIGYEILSGRRVYIFFYNSAKQLIKGTFWLLNDGITFFPSGTYYIRYMVASVGDSPALTPTSNYNDVTIYFGVPAVTEFNHIVDKTKWLAFGDSITYGVYSTGINANTNNRIGWANMLAGSLGYDITNMGSRGMGYMVTGQDPDNSSGSRVSFSTLVDRAISGGGDYNLVTIMLGTNDFNTANITLASVQASLSTELEKLVNAYPNARVIVITPLNMCNVGDATTKYALNQASANDWTLAELAVAIKTTCGGYGIECINVSDGFLFNTLNIASMLPDKIHPSYNAHKLIAKSMSHYLIM